MPKVKRDRITSTQFDTALLEEITHCRTMNVPINSVSSAASFTLMVRKRLYGDTKLLDTTNAALSRLIADAKAERAQYELEEQERRKHAERRIVLPPGATGGMRGNN